MFLSREGHSFGPNEPRVMLLHVIIACWMLNTVLIGECTAEIHNIEGISGLIFKNPLGENFPKLPEAIKQFSDPNIMKTVGTDIKQPLTANSRKLIPTDLANPLGENFPKLPEAIKQFSDPNIMKTVGTDIKQPLTANSRKLIPTDLANPLGENFPKLPEAIKQFSDPNIMKTVGTDIKQPLTANSTDLANPLDASFSKLPEANIKQFSDPNIMKTFGIDIKQPLASNSRRLIPMNLANPLDANIPKVFNEGIAQKQNIAKSLGFDFMQLHATNLTESLPLHPRKLRSVDVQEHKSKHQKRKHKKNWKEHLGVDCRRLRQHCRFNQDCCPTLYCFEHEGASHKRYCHRRSDQ